MDKLALVTGASSGIGYWLAEELATRGYDLAICSAGERLDEAASDFKRAGVSVSVIPSDLATREGIDQLWETVRDIGRPIDVACINAGIGVGGLFAETDLETELKMVLTGEKSRSIRPRSSERISVSNCSSLDGVPKTS